MSEAVPVENLEDQQTRQSVSPVNEPAHFVHLHAHSEFSLAEGLLKVKSTVAEAVKRQIPALALTDRNNLFALVKFYENSLSKGVKPILGAELWITPQDSGAAARIVALAKDVQGYKNLLALISNSYTEASRRGEVSEQQLFERSNGLIVLSGGVGGHLWQDVINADTEAARATACRWLDVFGDRYFLELTRTGRSGEERFIAWAIGAAQQLDIGVVATNDVCFLDAEDFEAHETRVCIFEGRALDDSRRPRTHSAQQYLRSAEEMAALFADIPQAIANSVEIAKRCNVQVSLGTYYLPDYPIPDQKTPEDYLKEVSMQGLEQRLSLNRVHAFGGSFDSPESYQDRLDFELNVINQMGFAGYFLIVMEFIAWAKANDIPVGPGRGSGGGSLVAYALGITDLDPLEYDLLFERFLNPERVSMPDFDVDFCMEGRDRVIAHVSELYGAEAVSQIITFGTMAAKAVVRDVARVQGKPYGLADKLSKLIPFEVGMTLAKAMDDSEDLRNFVRENDEVSEIMDMAYKLEGIVRNVGRHAGGVVIAPSALTDFVPLYTEEAGSGLVSQYDKDDVERAGLVKFDFLGLKTLTIIDWAVKSINAQRDATEPRLRIEELPLGDKATFELMRRAETTGIFQLESRGMKDLIRRLLPDNINDIIALVALFRPGPLQSGAVDDYINRKHGKEPVSFPHPSLDTVLEGTYGVVLYQEQVMQIAQVLAGFSLGQADLLRRAMGKKKAEEMAKVREQFLDGTAQNDVSAQLANEIFDLMEKFAGYAFNKSHSATYALLSFQTAWLKTHYPAEFMAANLSADMQNIDRVVVLIDEVRRMKLALLPPSVNKSEFRFCAQDGAVIYGLGAVRGVGEGPVEAIVEARASGDFKDLADFCQRLDSKKVNKRVLEALISAGAMDDFAFEDEGLDQVRARLKAQMPMAIQGAEQVARDAEVGITDLFGGIAEPKADIGAAPVVVPPLTSMQRLQGEKETLGLFLTGHPIDGFETEIRQFCRTPIKDLRTGKHSQWVTGMVVSQRVMKTKRGTSMGFLVLDDRTARLEVSLFSEAFEQYGGKVSKDELLVVEGEVQHDEYSGGTALRASRVLTIDEARQRFARGLQMDFSSCGLPENFAGQLKELICSHLSSQFGGVANCPIEVLYPQSGAVAKIVLGNDWRVQVSEELLQALSRSFDAAKISLNYQ
jgi:DNA polymerase-3 subunit alpha